MIPILFPADATDFTTNGIGALSDAKQCRVTEERNGQFELRMVYPIGGLYFNELSNERLIVAKPSKKKKKQAFFIYSITDNLDGTIEVLARHISYRANYVPIKPFSATGIQEVITGLSVNALEQNPFTITTDFENDYSKYNQVEPRSLRACLGGEEGSILDVFSSRGAGEYEWDNFDIKFWMHRGSDKGYEIRYAKNLEDYSREQNSEETITGCIAYWRDPDTNTVYYGDVQYAESIEDYPVKKTVPVDASSEFATAPTRVQLNDYAKVYVEEISTVSTSIDISFVDISDHDLELCDTVRVYYSLKFDGKVIKQIDYRTKIIKTIWDVLLDRYHQITVGDNKSSLGNTIDGKVQRATDAAVAVAVENRMISVVHYIDEEVGEAKTAIAELKGTIESSLSGVRTLYLMNDGTVPSKTDEGWAEGFPVWEEGKTIWSLIEYNSSEGSSRTDPSMVTNDGSIIAVLTEYYLSQSEHGQQGGAWGENLPPIVPGYFLWTRLKFLYSDSTSSYTDPVLATNNLYNVVTEHGTRIQQNSDEIALRTTKTEVREIAEGISGGINLSPYFSHDLNDYITEATDNDVYWRFQPSDSIVQLENGWANINFTNDGNAEFIPDKDARITEDNITALVEIKNLDIGSGELKLYFNKDSSNLTQYSNIATEYLNITENGTYYIPLKLSDAPTVPETRTRTIRKNWASNPEYDSGKYTAFSSEPEFSQIELTNSGIIFSGSNDNFIKTGDVFELYDLDYSFESPVWGTTITDEYNVEWSSEQQTISLYKNVEVPHAINYQYDSVTPLNDSDYYIVFGGGEVLHRSDRMYSFYCNDENHEFKSSDVVTLAIEYSQESGIDPVNVSFTLDPAIWYCGYRMFRSARGVSNPLDVVSITNDNYQDITNITLTIVGHLVDNRAGDSEVPSPSGTPGDEHLELRIMYDTTEEYTVYVKDINSFTRLTNSYFYGTDGTMFDARVSLYAGSYEGTYKPYITDHEQITYEAKEILKKISNAFSEIKTESDRITSTVTEINRVENSIRDVSQNVADELISASEARLSTSIEQKANDITFSINEVNQTVLQNQSSITEIRTYFTFASDGLIVGKNDSDIRGRFSNSSLDFLDKNGDILAWLSTAEGLGANILSVGSSTNRALRWKIQTDSTGNYLRFTRHY